jgi:hypothetical protein
MEGVVIATRISVVLPVSNLEKEKKASPFEDAFSDAL